MPGGMVGKIPPLPVPVEPFVQGGPGRPVWLTAGLSLWLGIVTEVVFVDVPWPLSSVVGIIVHSAVRLSVPSAPDVMSATGITASGPVDV